mmetsp:Transcript_10342/g.7730  ORF Transcript_10342/g.7730 Transcript_10342/m.7730 type:complete len:129 (+) Transcript_10342:128-514(+)
MIAIYNFWANGNYFLIALTFEQLLIVAYASAATQEQYSYWIRTRLGSYYFLVGINVMLYFILIGLGTYAHSHPTFGIISFLGLSLVLFALLSMTPIMLVIMTSSYYLYLKFSYESLKKQVQQQSSLFS